MELNKKRFNRKKDGVYSRGGKNAQQTQALPENAAADFLIKELSLDLPTGSTYFKLLKY